MCQQYSDKVGCPLDRVVTILSTVNIRTFYSFSKFPRAFSHPVSKGHGLHSTQSRAKCAFSRRQRPRFCDLLVTPRVQGTRCFIHPPALRRILCQFGGVLATTSRHLWVLSVCLRNSLATWSMPLQLSLPPRKTPRNSLLEYKR